MYCAYRLFAFFDKTAIMSRNVFLSFLGNNTYQPACYTFNKKKSKVVRFVQAAILELETTQWTSKDAVYIFLTPEATKNNWDGGYYKGAGLAQALQRFPHLSVQPIKTIPSELSETEIWTLFTTIFQLLSPQDNVYLDITNGFRSLPMLLMVLLDYAKTLKGIQVQKIYYGAFEVLGSMAEVEKNIPNPAKRVVPIWDLTSFSALQDWTTAASDFQQYGKVEKIRQLVDTQLDAVLTNTDDLFLARQTILEIDQYLQIFLPLLETNRGKHLGQFDFTALDTALIQFSANKQLIQPLGPILQQMRQKIKHFKKEDALFWLKSAQWCHQHGLIQQGITQLHEGFITWLCFRFQQMTGDAFFDAYAKEARTLVNSVFTVIEKDIPEKKWRNVIGRYPHFTKMLLQDPLVQQSLTLVKGMGALRNDINHGGYILDTPAPVFTAQLAAYIEQIKALVQSPKVSYPIRRGKGLVNCSPYPFAEWPINHQNRAKEQFGQVQDIPFPSIAPTISAEVFAALVETYFRKIKALRPTAVHLMGELTFTFALVQRLQRVGVECLVSMEGFVGFRQYE